MTDSGQDQRAVESPDDGTAAAALREFCDLDVLVSHDDAVVVDDRLLEDVDDRLARLVEDVDDQEARHELRECRQLLEGSR